MAFDYRTAIDYYAGALSLQATLSDTALKSAAFTSLPADYAAAGKYLPVTLYDDALKVYEVVWLIGHSSLSDTVTVARGKQGTAPRAWPAGSQFVVAPTARDVLGAALSTAMPSDPYIGERVVRTNLGDTVERAKNGWMPSVGIGLPADMGQNIIGQHPPDGVALIKRCGSFNGTTDADGKIVLTYTSPFPNATFNVQIMNNVFGFTGQWTTPAVRANGVDAYACTNATGGRWANSGVAFMYEATGW